MLAAGLDGIRRELKPGDPVNIDTYKMSEQDLAALGMRRLPWTLGEAVSRVRAAASSCEACSAPSCTPPTPSYKRAEWQEYNTVVSEWEQARYLRLW